MQLNLINLTNFKSWNKFYASGVLNGGFLNFKAAPFRLFLTVGTEREHSC